MGVVDSSIDTLVFNLIPLEVTTHRLKRHSSKEYCVTAQLHPRNTHALLRRTYQEHYNQRMTLCLLQREGLCHLVAAAVLRDTQSQLLQEGLPQSPLCPGLQMGDLYR